MIVGGDDVSYGSKPKDAPNWREKMLSEVSLDPTRTHFMGKLPYETYKTVLQVSAAHVYLTYPFVLSWSMLEAQASGCVIVGSKTPPVEEIIAHGVNGYLADFHAPSQIASKTIATIENQWQSQAISLKSIYTTQQDHDLVKGLKSYFDAIKN